MKSNPSISELARVISAGKKSHRGTRPPGPRGSSIMGVVRAFNPNPLRLIERAQREYGDIVWMRFLYVPALFLYHPDDVEYVLTTNPKNFIKSMTLRSNFFQRLVGNGLLTSQGEDWKRARRLSQPAFHRERIATYADTMVDYTRRLTSQWQAGEMRHVHRDVLRLPLEIVVKCLFSSDVSDDVDEVGATLKLLVKPFASQATLGWILNNRLPPPYHFRFHALAKNIDTVVYRIIAERRASGKGEGGLLSMLLAALDEDGSRISDRQLRGHDTALVV